MIDRLASRYDNRLMGMTIDSNQFETLRGGTQRQMSFPEFFNLSRNSDSMPFVIEKMILPDIGDDSWGYFVVREEATRVPNSFRRPF